jgi:hypothetical protein
MPCHRLPSRLVASRTLGREVRTLAPPRSERTTVRVPDGRDQVIAHDRGQDLGCRHSPGLRPKPPGGRHARRGRACHSSQGTNVGVSAPPARHRPERSMQGCVRPNGSIGWLRPHLVPDRRGVGPVTAGCRQPAGRALGRVLRRRLATPCRHPCRDRGDTRSEGKRSWPGAIRPRQLAASSVAVGERKRQYRIVQVDGERSGGREEGIASCGKVPGRAESDWRENRSAPRVRW